MNLESKVAIVAGGGRDIGRACALELANCGAKVILSYHSSQLTAEQTVAEIIASGGSAVAVQADLTNEDQVNGLVEKVLSEYGCLDILVHVAGGLIARKPLIESDNEHWKRVMDVNLNSLFFITRACVAHIREGGSIVTFGSQAGRDGGGPGALAYATSKGAVMTFTRALAKEMGPKIRVNSVCPGMIDTTFHDNFTQSNVRSNVAAATALKREGRSEEVAKLVSFLVSDDASYMTGNCVDINGGLLFS